MKYFDNAWYLSIGLLAPQYFFKRIQRERSKERNTCYLAGDFDMKVLKLENNTDLENFLDTVTHLNSTPLVTSPSTIKTKSVVDD